MHARRFATPLLLATAALVTLVAAAPARADDHEQEGDWQHRRSWRGWNYPAYAYPPPPVYYRPPPVYYRPPPVYYAPPPVYYAPPPPPLVYAPGVAIGFGFGFR